MSTKQDPKVVMLDKAIYNARYYVRRFLCWIDQHDRTVTTVPEMRKDGVYTWHLVHCSKCGRRIS